MDALDALFCFGFKIVKCGILEKAKYKLDGDCSDVKNADSIKLLLKEIHELPEYYAKQMMERGDKL